MAHRLAPQAETDLLEIWHYVATNSSVDVADRLIDSLTTRFFLLASYPLAGRQRDEFGTGMRAFPVGEYVILYLPVNADVLIHRVVRGSRDLEAIFRE
jgi:toxin ParE1/3/4